MLGKLKQQLLGEALPCYIISREPAIIISYWHDFYEKMRECVACLSDDRPAYVLAMLGWHRETQVRVDELENNVRELQQIAPHVKPIFLANCPNEQALLVAHGLEAVFCHQNAFLDEKRYKVISGIEKHYDAIYVARITPFKRHELAAAIPSLRLIGTWHDFEQDHYDRIMNMLPQADWKYKVRSRLITREINAARTGLCLSEEEGAMFVSAEYLLCGIPIVNTHNLGGRDEMFTHPYALTVEASAEAVAEGVKRQIAENFDPRDIRNAIIEKMKYHRQIFIELVQSIYDQENIERDFSQEWNDVYIHKLGIRRSVPLLTRQRRILIKERKLN
jgi:glycosyltransferase involved in cell wall biosynthesis